jgi:uncharacterized LabA/DUF88 family protein
MEERLKRLLKKTKGKKIGLFIDNANWFYPQKELGWDVDFEKLLNFLENYYKVKLVKLYAGTPLDLIQKRRFKKFTEVLKKFGYVIETKPLKKIWLDRKKGEFIYKCNFVVEISLDVARNIKSLDLVMIGSGDSDFLAVRGFALENKKGFIALCFEKGVAWEIRKGYHIFLEDIRSKIQEKK